MTIPQAPCLMTFLLTATLPLPQTESAQDFVSWQALAQRQYTHWPTPAERAVAGGFSSLNLATAFAFGYQAALQALVPDEVDYNAASFCVTESGGNKPAAISTSLRATPDGWRLHGQKSFVSGAEHARRLLVAACTGQDEQGRNRLALVALNAQQPGVQIAPLPPLPFAPELSHGSVHFDNVRIEAEHILPGDGYTAYVKPFRTLEDIYISLAVLGHCLGLARNWDLPRELQEELLVLISLHQTLAHQPPSAASTHLLLAGARQLLEQVLGRLEQALAATDANAVQRWQRDRVLLNVAGKARAQRRESAWSSFALPA